MEIVTSLMFLYHKYIMTAPRWSRGSQKGGEMTQDTLVLEHLKSKPITTLDAIKLYGVTRLSAVIWRLRHSQQLDIRDSRIEVTNRFGNKTYVKEYYLVESEEE